MLFYESVSSRFSFFTPGRDVFVRLGNAENLLPRVHARYIARVIIKMKGKQPRLSLWHYKHASYELADIKIPAEPEVLPFDAAQNALSDKCLPFLASRRRECIITGPTTSIINTARFVDTF